MPNEETQQNPGEIDSTGVSVINNVISKIYEAKNVLIALSSDPSVDELAAAIGLSIYFDRMGKRTTAIYSGTTPNALEFLKPEEQFTNSTDALQDFVIAIDKNKADHLRYKIDGNYVKVYITPYGTKIGEEDLEFSYGDYNVDLVIALDVSNGIDLDDALREHGRIMHDATVINITTGQPGKFGEIEWSAQDMSSISEMAAELAYGFGADFPVGKDEATAFLTGIVAATDRFSNDKTTPTTMLTASKLMKSGANQQLIAKNITAEVDNTVFQNLVNGGESQMSVVHAEETNEPEAPVEAPVPEAPVKAPAEAPVPESPVEMPVVEQTEGEAVLNAQETEPVDIPAAEIPVAEPAPEEPDRIINQGSETVVAPTPEFAADMMDGQPDNTYGNMLTDAIDNNSNPAVAMAPVVSTEEVETPAMDYTVEDNGILPPPPAPIAGFDQMPMPPMDGPAPMSNAIPPMPEMPVQASVPETPVSDVPITADMPTAPVVPEAPVAPEVPEGPVVPIEPAQPVVQPTPEPLGPQPAMQDQVYNNQANDPTAFHIPGM